VRHADDGEARRVMPADPGVARVEGQVDDRPPVAPDLQRRRGATP
jgi:hypothetical protein